MVVVYWAHEGIAAASARQGKLASRQYLLHCRRRMGCSHKWIYNGLQGNEIGMDMFVKEERIMKKSC
jgi:hypothetical protein